MTSRALPLLRSAAALALAALAAGCAVTQPKPPEVDLPVAQAPTDAQLALLERWWLAFDDPALAALVDEALANNLDVASAFARIELARAQVLLAQSYLYPYGNLAVGASRSRISGVGSQPLPEGSPLISNDFSVSLELGYELDLWGRYRSGSLAARNELAASRYFRESVRAAVAADVAIAYFRLRAADAELRLLEDTLKTREETVQLQRDRFDGGIIGEYDLKQAQAERSAVVADLARARQGIGLLEGALATLAGRSPREVWAPVVARADPSRPILSVPELPPGLPSGLMERRPDIRRAEALLAATELRIQQARAAYYPSISLTAAYGSESAALADLFTSPASIWRFGASLLQPLFGLKAIEANVQASEAARDQALVGYRQTVQAAFREVHDALVVHRTAREILAAESARRDQLASALEVANLRYDAGRTSFLEVLDAQRQLLAAETLRIAAARDTQLAIVSFAKALGGGWEPAALADAMPR
ncbi:MAG: efflux transporter outer membrane subunit [Burkholderiales bacterium]